MKRLHVLKSNKEIIASTLNHNFSVLNDYLAALSVDDALVNQLALSSTLADAIADALLESDNTLIEDMVAEFQADPDFYSELVNQMEIDVTFMPLLVNKMEDDYTFMYNLASLLADADTNLDNLIANIISEDTRGVNTRTDISGVSASAGGSINYLATDSGTIRTKKSDNISTSASDYATNAAYDINGSYWVVEVDSGGNTFEVYRYDTETDYNNYHTTNKDDYIAGPTGIIGELYTTMQFLDLTTCVDDNLGLKDKTTGRILFYGYSGYDENTSLDSSVARITTVSLRVISASPNEKFIFATYNTNVSDNGFVTNVAHAISANDTLVYEIGRRVLENPSFATELSQNLQKVRISIQTETLGDGTASGAYTDLVEGLSLTGTLLDDYSCRYSLVPRLSVDSSGNYEQVGEPWIISEIIATPYLDTSGGLYEIIDSDIDTSGGCFMRLDGSLTTDYGTAIHTYYPQANSVVYVRDFHNYGAYTDVFLTSENVSMPVIDNWQRLGWSAPPSGQYANLLDTIDYDCNFDLKIYKDSQYGYDVYNAENNIDPLHDLRTFTYYTNTPAQLFLELRNNYEIGLGNPNKFLIDIYGYRLIDRDIGLTPGYEMHDHTWVDFTDQVDGVNTEFIVPYNFTSTLLVNNGIILKRGIAGDSSTGEYYDDPSNGKIVMYEVLPSGEWLHAWIYRVP